MTKQDKDDLEMIATCGTTEAQMIEELLKNNGIECTLQGNVSANVLPTENDFDEVRIWVKRENAAAAQELVDAFFTPVGKDELEEGSEDLGVENPDEPGGFTV
jgi:putative signal transducing protein